MDSRYMGIKGIKRRGPCEAKGRIGESPLTGLPTLVRRSLKDFRICKFCSLITAREVSATPLQPLHSLLRDAIVLLAAWGTKHLLKSALSPSATSVNDTSGAFASIIGGLNRRCWAVESFDKTDRQWSLLQALWNRWSTFASTCEPRASMRPKKLWPAR